MNILITGAAGFVGKNLTESLKAIRDGKDRRFPELSIGEIFCYDLGSPAEVLEEGCKHADFVFHLAGVNRPKDPKEFMEGNFGFSSVLLETLKKHHNTCPVMLSSSIQATLEGRYDGPYGQSKLAGEELFFSYGQETGSSVLIYRFPNIFGKWCRPNYNSVVATFCHNYAHDLPITVSDPDAQLELCYIDDLVEELIAALQGKAHWQDRFCVVPVTHKVTLGQIVELLDSFRDQPRTLMMPQIPGGSFAKKLYSTYLSYLPRQKAIFSFNTNADNRGSFTELLKTPTGGQFSVNISKPGATKGQHWHHTKWEFFIVVSGRGLIRQRKVGTEEILDFEVSGDCIQAVHMLPGYAHNIINLSDTEDLVTLMWANECFDPNRPDTFFEVV